MDADAVDVDFRFDNFKLRHFDDERRFRRFEVDVGGVGSVDAELAGSGRLRIEIGSVDVVDVDLDFGRIDVESGTCNLRHGDAGDAGDADDAAAAVCVAFVAHVQFGHPETEFAFLFGVLFYVDVQVDLFSDVASVVIDADGAVDVAGLQFNGRFVHVEFGHFDAETRFLLGGVAGVVGVDVHCGLVAMVTSHVEFRHFERKFGASFGVVQVDVDVHLGPCDVGDVDSVTQSGVFVIAADAGTPSDATDAQFQFGSVDSNVGVDI